VRPVLALPDGPGPVFLRLADAVVSDIRRGRLRPGDPLPGTRRVAEQLGVHRNTVLAAWSELESQGWIEARPGARTVIAPLPEAAEADHRPRRRVAGFDVPSFDPIETAPDWPPGSLILAGGRPDLRLLPAAEIARAWRAAVRNTRGKVLDYGDATGHPRLRAALAGLLAGERGLAVEPDEVLVTRGAQQALYLAATALLRPGDRVAVERFGYPPAWAAFRSAGAELVPVEVDGAGLAVERLEALTPTLRAIYVTPHHQFPTMATLPAARRLALLALARKHRIAVIEDDYDNEYHYVGRPVLPLASMDRGGVVVYVGTLSKTLAPGLRLGYLVAPRGVVDAAAARRLAIDRQGDHAGELAVATLIEDGTYGRHFRRMRKIYAGRQAAMVDALRTRLGEHVSFEVPMGGLALWVRVGDDAEGWARRAEARQVCVETARRYDLRGEVDGYFRCGFASLTEDEIASAVAVLAGSREPLR
jgi:GntR family transcriptional regulator/MocR family aminotransferase